MSNYRQQNNNGQHGHRASNTRVIERQGARILCVADIRGCLASLNVLASQHDATHILHSGDFGFYDKNSIDRITDKTLRHVVQYSPLVGPRQRGDVYDTHPKSDIGQLRRAVAAAEPSVLSDLPEFLAGRQQLNVPVYTVWGACEDVRVLEKFRAGEYKVANLHIVDEASSPVLAVGGLSLRLLGLGGALVQHKLFDIGEGQSTIAGGQGVMWTTALQMGELLHTADRTYSTAETRILMTHHAPGRDGLLTQLAHTVKADFTISAGLHFRYTSSYSDYTVAPSYAHFAQKLGGSRSAFMAIYDVVKPELTSLLSSPQDQLLQSVLHMVESMPKDAPEGAAPVEGPFKNTWHFNLPDSQFGSLVLAIQDGRVSEETKSQGFSFGYRRGGSVPQYPGPAQKTAPVALPRQQQQQEQPSANVQRQQVPEKATTPPPMKETRPAPAAPSGAVETPLPTASETSTQAYQSSPIVDQRPGLWVQPCASSDRAKELFPTSTDSQIKKTATGKQYAYIYFSSQADMQEALSKWEQKDTAAQEGIAVKVKETTPKTGFSRTRGDSRGGRGAGRGGRGGRGGQGRGAGEASGSPAPTPAPAGN